MLRRVQKYIRDYQLLAPDDRVLIGVSGGADSMALWDVLQRAGYNCIIAHCNFQLRQQESQRDEIFVTQEAIRRQHQNEKTKLLIKHFNTNEYAKQHAISIEMAARELRYQWFEEMAEIYQCQAIAVAHHQNDQAETVLLNLKRGTGIRGLCGMRPISNNPTGGNIPIIRPLLCTTREYIQHYLKNIRHITWVEDSTNQDTNFTRNAIRQQIAHYTKAEIEHIAATAEYMQGYVDWIENKNTTQAEKIKLFEQLREYHFPEINKIYQALQTKEGGKTFYAPKHKATIRKGKLIIECLETSKK